MADPVLSSWARLKVNGKTHMLGVVSGHPTLADGRWLVTGRVTEFGETAVVAGTPSRLYRLGAPMTGRLPTEAMGAMEKAAGVWKVPIDKVAVARGLPGSAG